MRTIYFQVPFRLPDENQLMDMLKRRVSFREGHSLGFVSRYAAFRKETLSTVGLLIKSYFHTHREPVPKIFPDERCRFRFDWYEADKKRDPDNVTAGGRKIILDAMHAVGIWAGDGARFYVQEQICMVDAFHYGHAYEGVQVFIQIFNPEEAVTPL